MPSLKEYKAKLASLSNTRKMTKTMKMVAASKLYRTMDAQRKALLYATKLTEMLGRLAASVDPSSHPLLQQRDPPRSARLLIIMSDKGMCGGFNNNLIKYVLRWLEMPGRPEQKISFSFAGRRGWLFFRNRVHVAGHYEGVTQRPTPAHALAIGNDMRRAFLSGAVDEVYIAYNRFISPLSQRPVIRRLLPIVPEAIPLSGSRIHDDYILEPKEEQLLAVLLPKIIDFEIYFALLENAAGENGARMTAMDNATNNATKMIRTYTLLRNRARQAAITKELIEIVSGAEALKG
ncbi:MAG: ATP synthase F1 subunit gamma [Kiritimatiellae bacterium]|nr:ATP synthase F1 subunit gamma [Kiritimatiellia bacterium]MDW8459307.1 ATP synthase F1 subunit gamma [Verrucomicrobiota bacterium]